MERQPEGKANRGRAWKNKGHSMVVGEDVAGGSWLWYLPMSPGRQKEQGIPALTQAHLRHLAMPIQKHQRFFTSASLSHL